MERSKRKKKVNKARRKRVVTKKVKTRTKAVSKKRKKSVRRTRVKKSKSLFFNLRKLTLKTSAFLILICLNWAGLSAVITTVAYLNDTESSLDNNFTAGTLDFILTPSGFNPSMLEIGESATKTISFVNNGNDPKYKVSAINFSGLLCDYLDLTAYVDATGTIYSGDLTDFVDFGPQEFSAPDDWFFNLTLQSDTPEELVGKNCQFDFSFFGSQIRNDLPFGQGFNDIEEENNNVKAAVCYDAITKSKGYWKEHYSKYKSYLPQYLGCNSTSSECVERYEEISNKAEVIQVLETDYSSSMRNKLRGQLLAMKFNIAHFEIGEYVPGTSTNNLNQIAINADALLQQNPEPSNEILEEMKNYVEYFNTELGEFRHCSASIVRVIIPNGGEVWWVGRYYDLTWTTKNLVCSGDSLVSIWYSNDSGTTWGNIITGTENDGVYNWRIPLYLENGGYYVPSDKARIKVVTQCSETLLTNGWDKSDADFCPPIDYDLLLPEEIEALKAMGMYEEPPKLDPPAAEGTINMTGIPTETTTTEEISTSSGSIEIPAELIEVIPSDESSVSSEALNEEAITEETNTEEPEETTEETIADETIIEIEEISPEESGETTIEEVIAPEESAPEETPAETVPVETPAPEQILTQETPVTESQPIVIPDSGSSPSGDGTTGDGSETASE